MSAVPPFSLSTANGAAHPAYRLLAATGLHRGDRAYQQDQVEILPHPRVKGCLMAVLADGMGGKSGGRKAADQVLMTARQLFERHLPDQDDAADLLRQLVLESHLMIKLTAIATEEEPHSTLAAFVLGPNLSCELVHAGDSRIYHFRGADLVSRTIDHSYVQRLVDEGRITEDQALEHPQGNLLTGCLGSATDPPNTVRRIERLEPGDTLMSCSDGLWHYFTPRELGLVLSHRPPREAVEDLIQRARTRSGGGGDNISVAAVRIEALP